MRLCGDIGGTKVLLGLVDDAGNIVRQHRFEAADFPGFDALLAAYLKVEGIAGPDIAGGCLAVAGPVADNGRRARITNLPWTVDGDALTETFGCGALKLVNDFVGAAMGVAALAPAELVTLQPGEPLDDAPRLVVGAGTGLGMATMLKQANGWRVLPGEGGNTAFAPGDARQGELWRTLHALRGRVIWGDVVSGPGIANIYRFLCGREATPDAITRAALAGDDADALAATAMFLSAYGAFAGDMALALLPRGGVYVAGGIAAKILPLVHGGGFMAAFNDKGAHAPVVARMPVHVVSDPLLCLRGAAQFARPLVGR
jgi:glucokinase